MKIPYFCCIGAELKRYAKDFDFMNQVYLYKVPADDTIEEVLAQDYFEAVADTVLQDDIVYIYEPTTEMLYTCHFNKQNGHITAEQMANNIPSLTPNKILISDATGHITAGDVSLDYIKNQLLAKVNIDGSSIMAAPLKFASGSMRGAVGPCLNGVGFWKMASDNTITLIATLSNSQFLPATTNTADIGSSAKKWKDLYVARVIAGVLNNGADINIPTTGGTLGLNDFSNITDSAKNIGNWSSNVSNCITEIPQDIKLELSGGTLTLNAGSKVYVPNGSGVFNEVTISADRSTTSSSNGTSLVLATSSGGSLTTIPTASCVSGTSDSLSGQAYHIWYDTVNNVVNYYGSDGSTVSGTRSFPVAVITVSGGVITSIDQVFNGFGYIGSTVFALPGVKGLIPNGRNADGTLNNILTTVTTVRTSTAVSGNTGRKTMTINNTGYVDRPGGLEYNERENRNYNFGSLAIQCICGYFTVRSDYKITDFVVKTAFHAVDYSDTEYIAHQAMPSGRYVDLTLPGHGGYITMQADGYVVMSIESGIVGNGIGLRNATAGDIGQVVYMSGTGRYIVHTHVSKGDSVQVYHYNSTPNVFRIVYANGTK